MEAAMRKAMEEFCPGVIILYCGTHVFRAWEVFLQKNQLWKGPYTVQDYSCGMPKLWTLIKGNFTHIIVSKISLMNRTVPIISWSLWIIFLRHDVLSYAAAFLPVCYSAENWLLFVKSNQEWISKTGSVTKIHHILEWQLFVTKCQVSSR